MNTPNAARAPRTLVARARRHWEGRSRLVWAALVLMPAFASPGEAQQDALGAFEAALPKPLASRSLLLDGVSVDGLMVVVGERGHILLSRDQGVSWQQAAVPTRATLTGVFFHDDQLGWAVGHDAIILRTRDGGESWERLHFAPEEERPFLDVWFRSAREGFAIGAYGYFLATEDGGDTWESIEIGGADETSSEEDYEYEYEYDYEYEDDLGIDYHLNHISRSEGGRLYIAAEAGTIYRSDDEGRSWRSLPSPYEGSFFATLPLSGDSLLLLGLRGHLFRSDDAGESWQEIASGTQAMLTDGLRLEDGTVVVAGLAGTLLVSTDGGDTFTLRQQADRQGLACVLPADDGGLILIGEFGVNRLPRDAIGGGPTP